MRLSQRPYHMSLGLLGSMPRGRHIRDVGQAAASAILDHGTEQPLMQSLETSVSTQLLNSGSTGLGSSVPIRSSSPLYECFWKTSAALVLVNSSICFPPIHSKSRSLHGCPFKTVFEENLRAVCTCPGIKSSTRHKGAQGKSGPCTLC